MQRTLSAQALFVWSSMALLALIGLHWAQPPTTIAQIDLAPPYDAANMLGKCASVWNHVHAFIGSVDNCFSWTPHFALQALLQLALGTTYGQAIIFILPVMLSWLGAFNCARCLGASPFAAFVAAWMYAFNPARQSMIGVFATGEVCAALLPWVFYLIMLAALEPARRRFATAALVTACFAVVVILAITPQLLVALLIGSVVWLVFASKLAPNSNEFYSWAGKTALLVIAASLWWIVPNAVSYVGVAITHTADPMSVAWTFARASLLNELRFAPMWFWQYPEYNPWAIEFDRNALFYVAGLVPAAGLAGALLLARGSAVAVTRFLAIFALVMLFIAKGTHPPLEALNIAFYRVPGMFLFIEPYGAILIAALCMALACGIAADRLVFLTSERRSTVVAVGLGATFVGAALCVNLAAVTGAIFHEQTYPLPNVHITLPDYWRALASRLNSDPVTGGVAILPVDDFYQVDYDWGFHGADLLPVTLLHRAVLMPGAPLTYTQTPEARAVNAEITRAIEGQSADAARMLRDIGVRYVVVRDDVRLSHGFTPSPGDYARSFGKPSATYGALELYDLGAQREGVSIIDAASYKSEAASYSSPASHLKFEAASYSSPTSRAAERSATPLLSVVNRVRVKSTRTAFDVVNPGAAAVVTDILVGVWPRTVTDYGIRTSDSRLSIKVAPAERPVWARFNNLGLASGTTHVVVDAPATLDRRLAQFMPPRYAGDARQQPHVDQIEFAHIKMAKDPSNADSGNRWPPSSSNFALNLPLAINPAVTIFPKIGTAQGSGDWALDVAMRGDNFLCYAYFDDGVRYEVGDALRACFQNEGRILTTADQRHTTVLGMRLLKRYAGGPVASLSVESASSGAGTPAEIAATHERAVASTPLPVSLGVSVAITANDRATIATFEAYSPTWVAIESGPRGGILPHREALGWRNAWTVGGPGKIYIINWLVLAQWTLAIVGLIVVLVAWLRR